MYDTRASARRWAATLGRLAVATALVIAVTPVSTAYAPPTYGCLYGWADDATTFASLAGIRVQAFTNEGGGVLTPGPFTYTDSHGEYGLAVPGGHDYRVLFTDPAANPHQVYADRVFKTSGADGGYIETADDVTVSGGAWVPAGTPMRLASTIVVNVKRSGQYATPLKGMVASLICDGWTTVTRPYATDANGSVERGGVPAGDYRVTISDPSGNFGTVVVPGASLTHYLAANDEWAVDASLPLVNTSHDIGVSKPSCNSSVTHNHKLSVSGNLSKRVTGLSTMRLDAYQYAPSAGAYILNKQANL